MRSHTPLPVPIDERAALVARRSRSLGVGEQRPAYRGPARELDTTLWAGVLFWLGFAMLAVVAGF
ncbi:MAG: hypothetical protein Q8Q11_03545 [bacterium]|nr:hypothetical protein [bacterium]